MTNPTDVHPFEARHLGKAPFMFVRYRVAKYQACPGAPIQPGSTCDYCGTGIMGVYECRSADGIEFKVGCDCVEKVYQRAQGGAHEAEAAALLGAVKAARAAHKRAERDAARETERNARAAGRRAGIERFLADRPGLADALAVDHDVARDLHARLLSLGSLSWAQVALAFRVARDAAAKAEQAAEVKVAAPLGKQIITGTIVSIKLHDNAYGSELKMTVKVATPDGVYLTWGTVPKSICEQVFSDAEMVAWRAAGCDTSATTSQRLRGRTVTFTATLKPGRDAHFAIFSRPTKATLSPVVYAPL